MKNLYQIRVKGQIEPMLWAWFGDFTITHTADGNTLLTGTVVDQAALHGVFARCRDLGVTLISVNPFNAALAAQSKDGAKTMSLIHVEASEIINARAEDLYAVMRDYHVGHRAILPQPFFKEMIVEKGGIGAGTVITVRTEGFGKKFTYHMIVTEPEPGRRLVESNIDSPGSSSFIFEPLGDGRQTRVTISADLVGSDGALNFIEKFVTAQFSRRIFKQELRNLAEYVQHKALAAAV